MIKVATWNTEWATKRSKRGGTIISRLGEISPDILCLTETHSDFLDEWDGHVAVGGNDWGGPPHATRRKVLLWSRSPWRSVDNFGIASMPQGRFVRGVTDTDMGEITVIGVVIPYGMSNVVYGRRDRKVWEDHAAYLEALTEIIHGLPEGAVVLGDFNQQIPSQYVPKVLQDRLRDAFSGMRIATARLRGPNNQLAIDHIAYDSQWAAAHAGILSNINEDESVLSDHFGVTVNLFK